MTDLRFGPRLNVDASCYGCGHERSVSYRCQGDSGHDIYCDHPEADGRPVGDTCWTTPDWCPLGAQMHALRAALSEPVQEMREGERLTSELAAAGRNVFELQTGNAVLVGEIERLRAALERIRCDASGRTTLPNNSALKDQHVAVGLALAGLLASIEREARAALSEPKEQGKS